jgi:hypothetical protein
MNTNSEPLFRILINTSNSLITSRWEKDVIPMNSLLRKAICFSLLCVVFHAGCATNSTYKFGQFQPIGVSRPELVVEYGTPNRTIDRIRQTMDRIQYVLETPPRLLHLTPKHGDRELSLETIEKIRRYLEENDLNDVHIAVNRYDPAGQWQRIKENERIAPGWRYTLGVIDLCGYALTPGRIFGGNVYSPYANTLSLNSDESLSALTAAAYAKDIHGRSLPGTYAFASRLPLISVVPQLQATRDVIGYTKLEDDWDVEKEAYIQLYSQSLAQSTIVIVPFVPTVWGVVAGFGIGATGHLVGVVAANQRDKERQAESSAASEEGEIRQTGYAEDDEIEN